MNTRRFWQIHLSTAVVLMFVAASLLWLNLRQTVQTLRAIPGVPAGQPLVETETPETWEYTVTHQGWPFEYYSATAVPGVPSNSASLSDDENGPQMGALAADLAVCLALVALTGLAAETILRYRERRTE